MIECYRCGAEVAEDRFDLDGWAAIHAWENGAALFVCPTCQTEPEREMVEAVDRVEGSAGGAGKLPDDG